MDKKTASVFKSHVSVTVTLDNGERYIGRIVEVDAKFMDIFLEHASRHNCVRIFYSKVCSIEYAG